MDITLQAAVQTKLASLLDDKSALLLDLDDGVGPFSKIGVCSLDTSFRLLVVPKTEVQAPYTVSLESELGPVYIKDYTQEYFTDHNTVTFDARLSTLGLKTAQQTLDSHVELLDLRPQLKSSQD